MLWLLTYNATLTVFTFNLLARLTCPGMTRWCAKNCYACHGNFTYSNVVNGQDRRWSSTQDLDLFIETMVIECKMALLKGEKAIRIHSSGDFYSIDYFLAWLEIANQVPDMAFFAFTKNWRLPWFREYLDLANNIDNFSLWFSFDPSCEWDQYLDNKKVAFVNDPKETYSFSVPEPNCLKQLDKTQNCNTCGKCYGKNAISRVTFHKH